MGSAMDEKDQKAIERALRAFEEPLAGRLLSAALVGDAAGPDYRPRRSPLALALVVKDVTPALLRELRPVVRRTRRRLRSEAPMLFDPVYLESACDVFPVELLDIADRHRPLRGNDIFANPRIDRAHMRLEVEEQLRGKMLHLWHCTLGAAGSKRLDRRLLTDTISAFGPILRGLLYLHDVERPATTTALLSAVQETCSVRLPAMSELAAAAAAGRRLPAGRLDPLLDGYMNEVRTLVRIVDEL